MTMIKIDIEMPESCYMCKYNEPLDFGCMTNFYCKFTGDNVGKVKTSKRHENCPLIECEE